MFEINLDCKVFQRMHLTIMKEDTECNLNLRTNSVRKKINCYEPGINKWNNRGYLVHNFGKGE